MEKKMFQFFNSVHETQIVHDYRKPFCKSDMLEFAESYQGLKVYFD